jgi:predicted peroxiredoxin
VNGTEPGAPAHLLVETTDWCDGDDDGFAQAARTLASAGHRVVLVLIQDAVCAVTAAPVSLRGVLGSGVTVLVDDFSLRQRAVAAAEVPAGVEMAGADRIAELLLVDGVKVVWH